MMNAFTMNFSNGRFEPTPLYLLDTDEKSNRIFIKREDLLPYSFGGNKVRIGLEYLRDAMAKGCDHLVAYGNPRSNLCRVLSNLCAGSGLSITILSPADGDGIQPVSFNGRMCETLGAAIVPCLKTGVAERVEQVLADIRRDGGKPYYIYGDRFGNGNEAVPTAAYVGVYEEILQQGAALKAVFDAVFLAVGTGMTQAGLLCGQAMAGEALRHGRVMGISIAREASAARFHIQTHADAYAAEHPEGFEKAVSAESIEVYDDFRETYGRCGEAVQSCIRQTMMSCGIPLDETYTGKAFYGMKQLIRRHGWQGRDILFIHTGGTPLFFDGLEKWERIRG